MGRSCTRTTVPTPASEREDTRMIRQCPECDRYFDLFDPEQAEEFSYGHDCEAE